MTDRSLYDSVLRHDTGLFRALVAQLAQEFVEQGFDFVLGDAADGSILAHDLWRRVINAVVDLVKERQGRQILNYEFALEGSAVLGSNPCRDDALLVSLDDAAFARKIAAARSYPELSVEVRATLAAYGEDAFRVEYLRRTCERNDEINRTVPAYERHGESLVQAGIYPDVVRHKQHVLPLLAALQQERAA